MSLPPFEYLAPASTAELAELLATRGAGGRILAGGTDLINDMAQGEIRPKAVIDINRLAELTGIHYEPGKGMSIGATTRIEEIERSAEIRDRYFSLYQAAREIGSPQVRAMATLGGNSCNASPCADTPPPLVTFGTTVTLASRSGRREIPLEDFIRDNRMTAIRSEEYLERFHLPEPWPHSANRYATLTLRAAVEIDIASVAVNLALDPRSGAVSEVRIALGAVAPVPLRARQAEALLRGEYPSAEIIGQAAESCGAECRPIDDHRASAGYRRHVIRVLAGRVIREALAALR